MKKTKICQFAIAAFASVFVLLPAVGAAQSLVPATDGDLKITGTVSCTKFGNATPYRKGFSVAEAVHLCISQGYGYVIVSGKDIYPVNGDRKRLWALAGEKVSITGHVNDDRQKGTRVALKEPMDVTTIAPIFE